jgi:hypothetical protein
VSQPSKVVQLLKRLGFTDYMLYRDIGKDVLPTATQMRYPSPKYERKKEKKNRVKSRMFSLAHFSSA